MLNVQLTHHQNYFVYKLRLFHLSTVTFLTVLHGYFKISHWTKQPDSPFTNYFLHFKLYPEYYKSSSSTVLISLPLLYFFPISVASCLYKSLISSARPFEPILIVHLVEYVVRFMGVDLKYRSVPTSSLFITKSLHEPSLFILISYSFTYVSYVKPFTRLSCLYHVRGSSSVTSSIYVFFRNGFLTLS